MKALLFEPGESHRIGDDSRVTIIPDSAVTLPGRPIVMPDVGCTLLLRPLTAYRIGRLGKGIAPKYAPRYIDAVTCAAVLAAPPGELSPLELTMLAATDNYLTVGDWTATDSPCSPHTLYIEPSIEATTAGDITEAIATASRSATLKTGDIILLPVTAPSLQATGRLRMSIDGTAAINRRII